MIGPNPEQSLSPLARRVTQLAVGLVVAVAMTATFGLGLWRTRHPGPGRRVDGETGQLVVTGDFTASA